jgi:uncharacterized RDD family membrane protein YckC
MESRNNENPVLQEYLRQNGSNIGTRPLDGFGPSKPPSLFKRFLAQFLDGMIFLLLNIAVGLSLKTMGLSSGISLFEKEKQALSLSSLLATVFIWVLMALYYWHFNAMYQATPGKMALDLQVVKTTGAPVKTWEIIVRETFAKFLSSFCMIGYLVAFFRKDRRALHDLLLGTRVIHKQ